MIKLIDILGEESQKESYVPFMYSPVGFSCSVCRFFYNEDGKYKCKNKDYQAYRNTEDLVDDNGAPIKDPTKWCSNWFKPEIGEQKW